MDSYLEPERFEQARQTPYQPAMEMMIKYFIVPQVQSAHQTPALAFLKHMESLRRVNMNQVLEQGTLEKTVNLISSPGFLQLCHPDPLILTRDYEIIRRIERQYFHLLFDEGRGTFVPLDHQEALNMYRSLPEGPRFMLLEDEELCRTMQAAGITAVTPETLESLSPGRSGAVFAPSSILGLEECLDLLSAAIKKLRPGGAIKILERSCAGFPYGTAGYELLLGLLGAGIQMPLCDEPSVLTGTAGGLQRIAPGEMIQADWFTRVRDDQWPLPESRAGQEGIEISEHLHIKPGTKVYDCPCGDARISYQLALCGADVTGMDINPRFVEQAKARFRSLGLSGTFSTGDMRNASYPGGCDLFLNWFNSFGYFSEEENRRHMKTMADCIRPGGILVLEGPNLEHILENTKLKYQENGALAHDEWDSEKRRMNITYPPEKGEEAVVVSIRVYSLEEYKELFAEAGLVFEQVYAEHFRPYTPDAMRIILIARKPE